MPGEHSIYSPSGASRWLKCFNSVPLSMNKESKSSIHAETGTYAHELGAAALCTGLKVPDCVEYINKEGFPKRHLFTADMFEYVQTYVDTVKSMSQGDIIYRGVEHKVDLSNVYGVPNEFGTSDYFVFFGNELQVHDLKYGMGPVKAKENEQLIIYALGVIDYLSMMYDVSNIKIRLVIHQPRLYTVDEWETNLDYLNSFKKEVQEKIKIIEDIRKEPCTLEDKDYNPGEKTCYWCDVKGDCKACAKFNLDNISSMFDDFPTATEIKENVETEIKNVKKLTGQQQADIYKNLNLLSKWQEAFLEQMLEDLQNGKDIPDYKAVLGSSTHKAWLDKVEAEEVLKKKVRLKQEVMYKKIIITPTQALKAVKGQKHNIKKIEPLIKPGQKKPVIALQSDKREEVNISKELDNINDDYDLLQ